MYFRSWMGHTTQYIPYRMCCLPYDYGLQTTDYVTSMWLRSVHNIHTYTITHTHTQCGPHTSCIALHCIALHRVASHCITLIQTYLHHIDTDIRLHCKTFQNITEHNNTYQNIPTYNSTTQYKRTHSITQQYLTIPDNTQRHKQHTGIHNTS